MWNVWRLLAYRRAIGMAFGVAKTNRNEHILILFLFVIAAIRVFIFSAAFPLFSNIDEYLDFELITQYSHGYVPRRFDPLREVTLDWIVPYASFEFLLTADQ